MPFKTKLMDCIMPRKSDKRSRLVEAAQQLMHRQGYNMTTLNDIASESEVPLGNVYYYFKTKNAIGEEVIELYANVLEQRLTDYESQTTVEARLIAMVDYELEQAEMTAQYGCPIGGLCQELARLDGALGKAAAELLNNYLDWVKTQFNQLGYNEKSKDLALQFVANIQGMALLTNTFKNVSITQQLSEQIKSWVKTVSLNQPVDEEVAA